MDGGMEPRRPVLEKNKVCSWVRLPRLEGIGPEKLLKERSRREREGRRAREGEMEPERLQLERVEGGDVEAVITEQAVPSGSTVGGAVGGVDNMTSRVGGGDDGGGGPGGEAGIGVMGYGLLECYQNLGLGLHHRHVFMGGGGGRGSGRQSQFLNLRRHCRMYYENKD